MVELSVNIGRDWGRDGGLRGRDRFAMPSLGGRAMRLGLHPELHRQRLLSRQPARHLKRVAVSSNSHKAINNLLAAISKRAAERGVRFNGTKKGTRDKPETFFEEPGFTTVLKSEEVDEGGYDLVGATAFHFATDGCNAFDYLFVDEAGQVSLGNLIAMAGCAKNLVLVGDQMQLPQPVQGVHPGDTGLSTLDYALRDKATVPPERGVLLNVSWRMHPAVCSFISDAIYDGRLKAHPQTAARCLELDASSPLKPAGIVQIALAHEGSTQSAIEEAHEVARLLQDLLQTSWNNGSESRRLNAMPPDGVTST